MGLLRIKIRLRDCKRDDYSARSQASAEYWKYFDGGVHAFADNSAETEPIWMKSGFLLYCYQTLV